MKKLIFLATLLLLQANGYGFTIKKDNSLLDMVGYGNCDMQTNGEVLCMQQRIRCRGMVFDVGANKGQWSKYALGLKPRITLYSFEPIAPIFEKLKRTLKKYRNAFTFNLAFSKQAGTKTLFFYDKNQDVTELSGLYYRPILDELIGEKPKQVSIQTDTLDFFCQHHDIHMIDFLKIDTEGSELDILLGAYGLLCQKQIKTIQFEYGGAYLDSQSTLKQVYDLLSELHYTVYRIIPEGLIEITEWRDELEIFQYSNYLATAKPIVY